VSGRAPVAAIVGTGTQALSHLAVLAHVMPGLDLVIFARRPERGEAFAAIARLEPGIGSVTIAGSARDAVAGADVVVTAASFGPIRQVLTNDWLSPTATVVPVDYATYVAAEVARSVGLFLVDERDQFLANRDAGLFEDYPEPSATIGEALIAGTPRPAGRVLVTHLGVGLADVVFADAILRAATATGRGIVLPR
jgi:ornithine cyclodeaminase/alanine dehydrogenase